VVPGNLGAVRPKEVLTDTAGFGRLHLLLVGYFFAYTMKAAPA
jgi:hypothetical protein